MLHALQWPRGNRVLIPEITAVHLSTGGKEWGVNWKGRKSPRFEAPKTIEPERPRPHPHPPRPPRPEPYCP